MDWRVPSGDGNIDPFVVLATADLPNPPMTLQEKRDELTAAHELIRAKYDASIPFFTKDQLRDIVQQLNRVTQQREQGNHNSSMTISITSLDGFAV